MPRGEPACRDDAAEETILVCIAGGVREALCAEPAIEVFGSRRKDRVRITVCSAAADLYVGHPYISGIMYRRQDAAGTMFDRTIELTSDCVGLAQMMQDFAGQLQVTGPMGRPRVYVTSMDRLRMGRFGLKGLSHPAIAVILPEKKSDVVRWDTAAEIEERLGGSVIFIASAKHPGLEHGINLTGRLMPREMAAALNRADGWLGFDAEAAALGWAAGRKGIILDDAFESPDEGIVVTAPDVCSEALLAVIAEISEQDSEAA